MEEGSVEGSIAIDCSVVCEAGVVGAGYRGLLLVLRLAISKGEEGAAVKEARGRMVIVKSKKCIPRSSLEPGLPVCCLR